MEDFTTFTEIEILNARYMAAENIGTAGRD